MHSLLALFLKKTTYQQTSHLYCGGGQYQIVLTKIIHIKREKNGNLC